MSSQITVGSDTFLAIGDTVYYKEDNFPARRILRAVGKGVVWDYSDLSSPFVSTIEVKSNENKKEGDLALYEDGKLRYICNADKDLEITFDQSEVFPNKQRKYIEPGILQPGNLQYNKEYLYTSESEEIYSDKEIPPSWKKKIYKIVLPLRLRTKTITRAAVNAAGTLVLPWGAEEALMLKVETTKRIECSYWEVDRWIPLSEEQKSFLDLPYLQEDLRYEFYSSTNKLPLMIMYWGTSGPKQIKYQVPEIVPSDIDKSLQTKKIVAYPNPTFGEIKFELFNYPTGSYTIELYSFIGSKIWSNTYDVYSGDIISEDFSFLKKGLYLYSIFDKEGNKLTTKRISIITP